MKQIRTLFKQELTIINNTRQRRRNGYVEPLGLDNKETQKYKHKEEYVREYNQDGEDIWLDNWMKNKLETCGRRGQKMKEEEIQEQGMEWNNSWNYRT